MKSAPCGVHVLFTPYLECFDIVHFASYYTHSLVCGQDFLRSCKSLVKIMKILARFVYETSFSDWVVKSVNRISFYLNLPTIPLNQIHIQSNSLNKNFRTSGR